MRSVCFTVEDNVYASFYSAVISERRSMRSVLSQMMERYTPTQVSTGTGVSSSASTTVDKKQGRRRGRPSEAEKTAAESYKNGRIAKWASFSPEKRREIELSGDTGWYEHLNSSGEWVNPSATTI